MPTAHAWSFEPAGFFMLRAPILPFDAFVRWGEGAPEPAALRARLAEQLQRPEVLEALRLASPALVKDLGVWLMGPETEHGAKLEHALVRYFTRACSRATPFGLLAGVALGDVSAKSVLALGPISECHRRIAVSPGWAAGVARNLAARPGLRLLPNPQWAPVGARLVFPVIALEAGAVSHRQHDAETSPELLAVLESAASGKTAAVLAAELARQAGVGEEEAAGFVAELLAHQMLVPALMPSAVEGDVLPRLERELSAAGADDVAVPVRRLKDLVTSAEHDPLGAAPVPWAQLEALAAQVPGAPEGGRALKVDLQLSAPALTLGARAVREVMRGVKALYALQQPQPDRSLDALRDAFVRRFEDREVPLAEALDPERGLEPGTEPVPTALAGLPFDPPSPPSSGTLPAFLLEQCLASLARSERELVVDERQLPQGGAAAPPDAFAAYCTLLARDGDAVDHGELQIVLNGVEGPPGIEALGRFAHFDPRWQQALARHLEREEALEPDILFADIAHFPGGVGDDIVSRPALRRHALRLNSAPGQGEEISIRDLVLSVQGNRFVLRSLRTGREVMPSLSIAHDYRKAPSRLYGLLCRLRYQRTASCFWNWGPLQAAPFLPRVRCGRTVLALAQWRPTPAQLEPLSVKAPAQRLVALQALRAQLDWPRFVSLAERDQVLAADLDNPLSAACLADGLARSPQPLVREVLAGPASSPLSSPAGRHAHELIVPFVRARPPTTRHATSHSGFRASGQRTFAPGSPWLYLKAYCGSAAADRVLLTLREPLAAAVASGAATHWFFVRYRDEPGRHLRLRVHGDWRAAWPPLQRALEPLIADETIHRLQWDTYDRELERYGGEEATALAERLFHADSEGAMRVVASLAPGDLDGRFRLAPRWVLALLTDLGLEGASAHAMIKAMRQTMARELGSSALDHALSARHRRDRAGLEAALFGPAAGPLADAIAARSMALRPLTAQLTTLGGAGKLGVPLDLLASHHVHMSLNRLLRSAARAQELVIYDALERALGSALARRGKAPG